MKYRRFGRTDIEISELTFGGGWVGGILIDADDATRRTAIRRALAAGINWIDTAASYGDGQSETALGWLLNEIDDTPYLSTKVPLDLTRLDDIPGQIEASLSASLARLKRDSVDLLLLHNPIKPETGGGAVALDEVLRSGGVADGLERMRDQGLTKFVGLTGLGDAEAVRQALASGRFDAAQVYYNMLNPSAGQAMPPAWTGHDFTGVIETCKVHDVGIMNIRVYAAGVLATDVRHGREVVLTEASDVATEETRARACFAALGERDETRAQTAVRFCLANTDISTVVFGLAQLDHLDQAIAAQATGPLPVDALEKLRGVYDAGFARV